MVELGLGNILDCVCIYSCINGVGGAESGLYLRSVAHEDGIQENGRLSQATSAGGARVFKQSINEEKK
jgi:hypothetical protein